MYCYSDTATNGIDRRAASWTDIGLEVTFNVSAPPNVPVGIPVNFCATSTFTTSSNAITEVRLLVNGNPATPAMQAQIQFGSGERGPMTIAGCTNLLAGSHTIKAQYKTGGTSGNSCFSGTRFLTVLA
jgi:hypothetical protein